jgi:hypothetical protein
MPNPPKPVTFDAFLTAESQSRGVESSGPNALRQLVAEQLVKAKLVPASRSSQLTDVVDAARFLSNQVLETHQMIQKDGSANMNERRLSFQNVCLELTTIMAMAGGIEPPQE